MRCVFGYSYVTSHTPSFITHSISTEYRCIVACGYSSELFSDISTFTNLRYSSDRGFSSFSVNHSSFFDQRRTAGTAFCDCWNRSITKCATASGSSVSQTQGSVRIDVFQELSAAVDGEGYLFLAALQQVGLEVSFDDRRLEIRIQIPPTVRQPAINTLGTLPPEAANVIRPSQVSGYVNFQGTEDFIWAGDQQVEGRQPLHLGIDGALNIQGWVLESKVDFAEETASTWNRGDIRLVRDDPDRAIRYTAGEQIAPTREYQSSLRCWESLRFATSRFSPTG